ncbi:MAG: hypothetical protein RL154_1312, partial [Pseudomonadota bacterium]
EEVFKTKAKSFVSAHFNFENTNVAQIKIEPNKLEIKAFLIGQHIPQKDIDNIANLLPNAGLKNAKLKIYQNGEKDSIDISTLKSDIVNELYKNSQIVINAKNQEIEELNKQIRLLAGSYEGFEQLPKEIGIVFPNLSNIVISQLYQDANNTSKCIVINADSKTKVSENEIRQIKDWLKVRGKIDDVKVYIKSYKYP